MPFHHFDEIYVLRSNFLEYLKPFMAPWPTQNIATTVRLYFKQCCQPIDAMMADSHVIQNVLKFFDQASYFTSYLAFHAMNRYYKINQLISVPAKVSGLHKAVFRTTFCNYQVTRFRCVHFTWMAFNYHLA